MVNAETRLAPMSDTTDLETRQGGNKTTRHPLTRLISKLAFTAVAIPSMAFPALAQDGTAPMPENAQPRSYGAAWACEKGFVKIGDRCDAISLPANAFLDRASYGPGWRCERGYEPLRGACVAIDLPLNAYLDRSGNRWSCNRGFQLSDGACTRGR